MNTFSTVLIQLVNGFNYQEIGNGAAIAQKFSDFRSLQSEETSEADKQAGRFEAREADRDRAYYYDLEFYRGNPKKAVRKRAKEQAQIKRLSSALAETEVLSPAAILFGGLFLASITLL